ACTSWLKLSKSASWICSREWRSNDGVPGRCPLGSRGLRPLWNGIRCWSMSLSVQPVISFGVLLVVIRLRLSWEYFKPQDDGPIPPAAIRSPAESNPTRTPVDVGTVRRAGRHQRGFPEPDRARDQRAVFRDPGANVRQVAAAG